jgi:hypothetical protein
VKDYYKILGLKPDATSEEVRKAWHKLARKYHPDLHPDDQTAEEHFKLVAEAYEVLNDEGRRAVYDLTGGTVFYTSIVEKQGARDYFYARLDKTHVKVNDEVALTFTYSGKGRVFRKPSLDQYFITGPPYVSFRKLIHEDRPVRETSLTYIIAPVKAGDHVVGPASIRIGDKEYKSEPLSLKVEPNECYFFPGHDANGPPLKFPMNFEYNSRESKKRLRGHNPGHMIYIPRSKQAYFFHMIGSAMKVTFTLAGVIYLPQFTEMNFLFSAAAGSLIGGINCHVMYKMLGMRSKFRYADKFQLVQEYSDRGFQMGNSTGTPLFGSTIIYKFSRLIT